MLSYRFVYLLAAIAGLSFMARADVVGSDPWWTVDDAPPGMPISIGSPCPINGTGGGTCDYVNNTGMTIDLLSFVVKLKDDPSTTIPPDVLTLKNLSLSSSNPTPGLLLGDGVLPVPPDSPIFHCSATSFFTTCEIEYLYHFNSTTTDTMLLILSGGSGIAPNVDFTVNLNDNNNNSGVGGWGTDASGNPTTTQIGFAPASVPEPSFSLLLGVGCALVFGFARRRRILSR
jgi:PEP-CTERM motif